MGDGAATIGKLMAATKTAEHDYHCAMDLLAPFEKSSDEFIKGSADIIRLTLLGIILIDRQVQAETVAALDTANPKLGTYRRLYENVARDARHDHWVRHRYWNRSDPGSDGHRLGQSQSTLA